jgi:uncharacterized membrane protein
MPTFIGGLPLHPLVVHATVVLVPLSVLGALVVVLWPAGRRRYGWLVVAATVLASVCTIVAEQTGEGLEHNLPRDAAIEAHTELGDSLKLWVIPLMVVVAAFVLLHHRAKRTARREGPGTTTAPALAGSLRLLALGLTVVAVVLAVGAAVDVYRIGDSGARAVWGGRVYQQQPFPGPGGRPR